MEHGIIADGVILDSTGIDDIVHGATFHEADALYTSGMMFSKWATPWASVFAVKVCVPDRVISCPCRLALG